jgi:2-polyprenyl-3-methyl-5-hydroxy-6-metoxy-1,4-benzoquinol methylase
MIRGKIRYLFDSARKRLGGQTLQCPSCRAADSELVQRKFLVTELHRCRACRLLYRYPLDTEEENFTYYQARYQQGFTTDCPKRADLDSLLTRSFQGTDRYFGPYIDVLQSLGVRPGARVLDFGCSWGYGSWQLKEAGYSVHGCEISQPRARYAREMLGVTVSESLAEAPSDVDVFFSAHVLEHIPSVQEVVLAAREKLKPGGIFVAFTPNGSAAFRAAQPQYFRKSWGKVHPNLLDDEFYELVFQSDPFLLSSSPYDTESINRWNRQDQMRSTLAGRELLVVAALRKGSGEAV